MRVFKVQCIVGIQCSICNDEFCNKHNLFNYLHSNILIVVYLQKNTDQYEQTSMKTGYMLIFTSLL